MTVLILTVTYFSLLTPTSAYFYKEVSDGGHIKFSLFQVNNGDEDILSEIADIKFKGATKFADFDEKLFDEVAEVKTYTVTNTGNVSARVITRVTPLGTSADDGLKYMIIMSDPYTSPQAEPASEEDSNVAEKTTLPKGDWKKEIESRLTLFSGEATSVDYSVAVSALDAHNAPTKQTRVLNAKTAEIAVGQSVDVKIYFWAEYDEVMDAVTEEDSTLSGEEIWQDATNVASVDYSCKIEMIASQDKDEAVVEALETTTENQ